MLITLWTRDVSVGSSSGVTCPPQHMTLSHIPSLTPYLSHVINSRLSSFISILLHNHLCLQINFQFFFNFPLHLLLQLTSLPWFSLHLSRAPPFFLSFHEWHHTPSVMGWGSKYPVLRQTAELRSVPSHGLSPPRALAAGPEHPFLHAPADLSHQLVVCPHAAPLLL